jgi:hypothetical protein
MSQSNLKAPVNTPAVEVNDLMPLNGVHNYATQVAGRQINPEAFFHEVCLRLESVQAQPERQLGVWRYQTKQTEK